MTSATDNRTAEQRKMLNKLFIELDSLENVLESPLSDMTLGEYEQEREKLLDGFVQAIIESLGCRRQFRERDWQAIADELSAQNERTCINSESEIYPGGMVFVCSECEGMSVEGQPNYCPNCGAKVVG